jgi:hypothetical protein
MNSTTGINTMDYALKESTLGIGFAGMETVEMQIAPFIIGVANEHISTNFYRNSTKFYHNSTELYQKSTKLCCNSTDFYCNSPKFCYNSTDSYCNSPEFCCNLPEFYCNSTDLRCNSTDFSASAGARTIKACAQMTAGYALTIAGSARMIEGTALTISGYARLDGKQAITTSGSALMNMPMPHNDKQLADGVVGMVIYYNFIVRTNNNIAITINSITNNRRNFKLYNETKQVCKNIERNRGIGEWENGR